MAQQAPKLIGLMRHHFSNSELESGVKLDELRSDLLSIGASRYSLWLPETKYLARLLEPDERVHGAVYGRYKDGSGRGALFATKRRVIFIDKKPLFVHFDELGFMFINSVTFSHTGPYGIVALHTRSGDFIIRTLKISAAENFVKVVEENILKSEKEQITSYGNNYIPEEALKR